METNKRYETETVSHSGLSALQRGPKQYRGYKEREDTSSKGMNLGSAIHCKVLEPSEFDNRYLIADVEIPEGKNAIFVKELFNTYNSNIEYTDEVHNQWIQNAWEKSGLKGTPAKAWDALKGSTDNAKKLQAYWDYLEECGDKFQLSFSDAEIMNNCKRSIESHKVASELLFGYGLSDVHEELDIRWSHPSWKFNMRSIIDRLIIDEHTKTIKVVDLKTSAKSVHFFERPYEMYGYYRQIPLYMDAAWWYCIYELKMDLQEWKIEGYIVAVQTTGYNECAVYRPCEDDLKKGRIENKKLLDRLEWHFDNDEWDYPKEYYEGDGVLTLNIDD